MLTNKFKRQLRRAVSVCSAVVLVVCSVPGQAKTSTPKVTTIKLTSPLTQTGSRVSATLTMKKGSTFRIKAQLFPSSARKAVLTYKSSKKKIATVSTKGIIKAKNTGKTTITVSPKGNKKVKAVIKVTVKNSLKKVKRIKLNQNTLSLSLGNNINSAKLTAKITSPKKPTNKKIRWISENNNIVSVNNSGLVTAKKAGVTSVTAVAADGQGAKASCRVTVEEKNFDTTGSATPSRSTTPGASSSGSPSANTPAPPGTTTSLPSAAPPTMTPPIVTPSTMPSSPPAVVNSINITVPDNRTGIKQGENIQLTAKNSDSGEAVTDITWSITSLTGVSISESGLLSVSPETQTTLTSPKKITVTAKLKSKPEITDTVSLSVVENKSVLADNHIKLNEETSENPQGLSYRTADDGTEAYSTVIDPMRGSVTRVDEAIGYKNDMIAWLTVNPIYAGKTVHISAYIKYDKLPNQNTIGLVLNERWAYSNPATKWNATPGTWHYVTGTYDLPEYRDFRYDGTRNNLYLSRFSDLADDEHPVYYLDNVVFSVEKADIESVSLSSEDDTETIYQNHTRQYSAEVTGTKNPIQKVNYEIEPAVENVSISEDGLLTVNDAPAGSVINLKASSIEDPEKYDIRSVTVLAQSIDSIEISAENNPTEIYQNNKLQFTAEVSSTGEPDESVKWSVSPEVDGVSITSDGLLAVGKDVAGETKLCITATSVFDPTKKKDYNITVKENKVENVTIKSAGDKTTISSDLPLNLYADVSVTGTPSKDVTWSMPIAVEGASIAPSGNNCTLSIDETVAEGTQIIIRAVSIFDASKFGEITITVEGNSSEEFDLNKCSVEYWEDFSTTSTLDALAKDGIVSYQATTPDPNLWDAFSYTDFAATGGVHIMDDNLMIFQKMTRSLNSSFVNQNDYLQFTINNTESQEKSYTLSFMFRFVSIAIDSNYKPTSVNYELPLKLVSLDEDNVETIIKDNIRIPYPCGTNIYDSEFYEIASTINIAPGKKIRLQLKLDGDLPTCQSPDNHTGFDDIFHPIVYTIDNISISTGNSSVITIKKGETYQTQLNTVSSDQIEYYTNCDLAKYTHKENKNECTRFNETIASVDENGLVSANIQGDTTLIAIITHEDNTVERKQCTIHVIE